MRQRWKRGIRLIVEKKWLLFLVLTLFYFGTAALLHSLYERGVFQEKTYYKESYKLAVVPTSEEGRLKCVIKDCDQEVEKESAKKGDTFFMDGYNIYYKEDVYSYHGLKGNAWDYEVTFPDEKLYRFANGEDKYYSDVETREQDPEEAAKEMAEYMQLQFGLDMSDYPAIPYHASTIYSKIVDAPDPKYSPNLIRSALLAYKSYYDTDYLSESSVLKYTGFFWFLGIGFLCTRDFWMELELTKLSWRIEWQTTGSEFILEPSEWMRFSYLAGGVLVAAGAYIAMIGSYMHLR